MTTPDPLDAGELVVEEALPLAVLEAVLKEWPTAAVLREEMHRRDLARAAVPPVLHVTVTPPEGQRAVPGHFRVETATDRISWHSEPDTEPLRRVLPATRDRDDDRTATQPHEWLIGDPGEAEFWDG